MSFVSFVYCVAAEIKELMRQLQAFGAGGNPRGVPQLIEAVLRHQSKHFHLTKFPQISENDFRLLFTILRLVRTGGYNTRTDYSKLGGAVLIGACVILAVRTARWPAKAYSTSSDRELEGVYVVRWRESTAIGLRQRKAILGSVKELPTLAAARRAAAPHLIDVNQGTVRQSHLGMTVAVLAAHYLEKELPEDLQSVQSPKSHSTAVAYRRYIKKWILPKWGTSLLCDMSSIRVEAWLSTLTMLANGTKAKIRNIMSVLFNHAIRHGFLPRGDNAIRFVRQSAESTVEHRILEPKQVRALIEKLEEPVKTMAILAAFTGLRLSEFLALKWKDVDLLRNQLHVRRAIVYGKEGRCKTAASRKPVPLDTLLVTVLTQHRMRSPYREDDDWVFASPAKDGKKPYSTGTLTRWNLKPAAKAAGLPEDIGWHTFRRTFASLLIANGEDVKVVQESMRHANSKMTLDVYAQSTTDAKRSAQRKLIAQIAPHVAIQAPATMGVQ